MKNKILDDAFLSPNFFTDFIQEEETIVWQGTPSKGYRSTMFEGNKKNGIEIAKNWLGLIGFSILIGSNFLLQNPIPTSSTLYFFLFICWLLFLIGSVGVLYSEYQMFALKKNTQYAITNNWILHSKHDSFNQPIGMIGFFELESFSVILDKNGVKTFSIKTTTPKYNLDSYDFENGKKRKNITLELIENFELVEELLQKGIERNKKL